MEIIKIIIPVSIAIFIGYNFLYLISHGSVRLSFWEKIFLAYGLGFGLVTLEMLLFYFLNTKFNLIFMLSPWVLLFIINLSIYLRNKPSLGTSLNGTENSRYSILEYFFGIGIAFEVLYAFFRALIKPIEAYDAVATYAIRTKIFYLAKSVPHDFFSNLSLLFPHPDYPLNIPLSEAFIYLSIGNLNDQLVKVIFPLYFVAILGVMYFAVRRLGGRTKALLFTFILATVPQFNNFATNAYHDVPLAYYSFIGTLFLLYWFKENRSMGFLYISAVMTAFSAWTKNEGFVYCAANILLLILFLWFNRAGAKRKDIIAFFLYIGIILAVLTPWLWIKYTANLINSDVGSTTFDQLNLVKQLANKAWPIVYEFQRQIFGPKKWNIIWIIILFCAIIYHKKIFNKEQRYITTSLILVISGYVFVYLIGRDDIRHMIGTTWSRMMIHFLPLAVYWLASLVKDEEGI